MSNTREAAARWIDRFGASIVAYPAQQKGPSGEAAKGWPDRAYSPEDVDPDGNFGHKHPSGGLVDVDVDAREALLAATTFLPVTDLVHGRPSKASSHFWFRCSGFESESFVDIDGATLIEGRASHGQTMCPPSLHPCGERLHFESDGEPASVTAEELRNAIRNVAIAAIVARHWPSGSRHDAASYVGGFLAHQGLDVDTIEQIVGIAVRIARDEEPRNRIGAARDSARKFEAGKNVKGGPALAKLLPTGEAVVRRIAQWFGADGINADNQDLAKVTQQAWDALHAKNDPPFVFRHGGLPVRVERNDEERPFFQVLTPDRMRHELARVTAWYTHTKAGRRPAKPPRDVVADMLAQPDLPLPVVTRIISAPIIAKDGSIQLSTGYQSATRTFYPAPGLPVPPIPETPTAADVGRARGVVDEVLADFPFVSDADRAHAVALFLLPFLRELIDGQTPLHLFEKPRPGTGATLLTDVLLWPPLGCEPAKLTEAADDDEWRKRLTGALKDGPSVLLIDNVRTLTTPQLAAAITSGTWKDRLLGVSQMVEFPVRCAWAATGNNVTLSGEMARRSIRIRLDARTDRPWQRSDFRHADLRGWVAEHRADLVWAALTLARAWVVEGRPAGTTSLGNFEQWSRVIGGVLSVARISGFLANLDEFYAASDVEGAGIRWFLGEWLARFQGRSVTTQLLRTIGLGPESQLMFSGTTERAQQTQFGIFIRGLKDQVRTLDDGTTVRVVPAGVQHSAQQWKLEVVNGQPKQERLLDGVRDSEAGDAQPF